MTEIKRKLKMRCPVCGGSGVSKGIRTGTNIKRYICKKCGRNYSGVLEDPELESSEILANHDRANCTLNVRKYTKAAVEARKEYPRETIDDVIMRLIDGAHD